MKELEDHAGFPSFLRNYQTEFIGFVVSTFNMYDAFILYLKTAVRPNLVMNDLCSGSGEPAITIFKKSNYFTQLILSDVYPNPIRINDKRVFYEMKSKDVLTMEFEREACYTMFNSFHHFTNEQKRTITNKIQSVGAEAFIVEILEPTVFCFLKVLLATTLGCILLTPFVKPFSFKRLFFTYIFPVNIFTIMFDGLLSTVKSSTAEQYKKLFTEYNSLVEVVRLTGSLSPLTVIKIRQPK
ncbi:MAG: hypothetical protein H0X46_06815 [Bacteroidetes bacterium]|nr:hypothetical protein [Bacteroidota bacterium]